MKRLFIFDMDGTLLYKTSGPIEIAKITNTYQQLLELENRFGSGVMSTKEFAQSISSLWGCLEPSLVEKAFYAAVRLSNIDTIMNSIRGNGDTSCIITMSPDFFANFFLSCGFDYIFASGFPKTKAEQLDLSKILTTEDKPVIAQNLCADLGLCFEDSVAFGDSMSDYNLFQMLKYTVAVNGTEDINKISRIQYTGLDLLVPYRQIIQNMSQEK